VLDDNAFWARMAEALTRLDTLALQLVERTQRDYPGVDASELLGLLGTRAQRDAPDLLFPEHATT
jgi:hypothetical protein